jgi:hypothetical protein
MTLKWKRVGDSWRLYEDRRCVGTVVPDGKYPGMWRAKLPGGLSDMVNLTRAKDAVLGRAERTKSEKKPERNQGAFSAPSPYSDLNAGEAP